MPYELRAHAVVEGLTPLIEKLRTYGDRVYRRHARRAMTKAGRVIARAAKAAAPRESGLLGASMGSKVVTFPENSIVVAVVGPRRGFKRAVAQTKRGKLKHFKSPSDAGKDAGYRNPVNYAHLVEEGRRAVAAKNAKVLVSSFTGQFLGQQVRPAAGRHFLRRGFQAAMPEVRTILRQELAFGCEQEAMKRS